MRGGWLPWVDDHALHDGRAQNPSVGGERSVRPGNAADLSLSLSGEVCPISNSAGIWAEEKVLAQAVLTRDAQTGWLELLSRVEWDYFITVTFRKPRKDAYLALNAVENALQLHPEAVAFLGSEFHSSGTVHAHGLVHYPWPSPDGLRKSLLWRRFYERLGRSEVVSPWKQADVNQYVTKYCTKALTDWRILGKLGN